MAHLSESEYLTPAILLALPDRVLATLYSAWSEDTHAAGWYSGGEESFINALREGWGPTMEGLQPYEREGVRRIRALLEKETL